MALVEELENDVSKIFVNINTANTYFLEKHLLHLY